MAAPPSLPNLPFEERSLNELADVKYKPRTLEQREADAKRNAPKYAREKAVGSILTAKHLKAKAAFDGYFAYRVDDAWDADAGTWRDARDPWLRFAQTLPDFLQGYTERRAGDGLSARELQTLTAALVRVARMEIEGAGRDAAFIDDAFAQEADSTVAQLSLQYKLPPSPKGPINGGGDADDEEDDEEGAGPA